MAKIFIGDDLYAEYEDDELTLTREDDRGRVTDALMLDTSVLMLLVQFLAEHASAGVVMMLRRMLR